MTSYLNQGMYDVVEAAHLVQVDPSTIVRWGTAYRSRPALVEPSLGSLYSFHDLISLLVVAQLAKRKVPLTTIANGIRTLSSELQTPAPLAHRDLATLGTSFFARYVDDDWLDVGLRGQAALDGMTPDLRPLEYGEDRLAAVWRPHRRIWVNPRVQAGASCIDRTRMPTATIYQLVQKGDDPEEIAGDFDLALEDVQAAYDFERSLTAA